MPYDETVHPPTAENVQPRVILQPIAAPSILGLYGFAGATFMVAANMAHWFGNPQSVFTLLPFAALFGGLAQFLAGMWAFRARDGVAVAMHGMWGSFWMAYGMLGLVYVIGRRSFPSGAWPELGYWFIVLAAITWVGCYAASAANRSLFSVLLFLAAGATCAAISLLTGNGALAIIAGWLFIISAVIAWYTASALMLHEAFGREVWRVGKSRLAIEMPSITLGVGEPGVIRGQA
jgi:succinate-acetate transporter protein